MGQKTHPIGFRLGITKPWAARWYARADYGKNVFEDVKIRKHIKKKLYHAGIALIEIERTASAVTANIHSARPGLIIGKKGTGIDSLKAELVQLLQKPVNVNIVEVRKPELDAVLVAENKIGRA